MYVIGLVGWKNSGKTTFLESLVPVLKAKGATVSTIKHTHHSVDLDQPGKDTYRHREAGVEEVMLVSSARWALLREVRDGKPPTLDDVLKRMTPVGIVIIEGFKKWPHDKIEIHRHATGGEILALKDETITAVVSDAPIEGLSVPLFAFSETDRLARFVSERAGLEHVHKRWNR